MHGCGVNVLPAAEAICGLATDMRTSNPGMFSGLTSVTTSPAPVAATSVPDAANVSGAVSIEH
jgi:hypothetical protein